MTVPAEFPKDEEQRLDDLRSYEILDTRPEQAYDDLTFLAACICESPIALISFVDSERQWFKSKFGLDAAETSRSVAFCAHAILRPDSLFVVGDATKDARFAENPLVTDDPKIRFYAGAPLVTSSGHALGTLCVIDREPRELTTKQKEALSALSRQVVAQLELRETLAKAQASAKQMQRYHEELENAQRRLEKSNARLRAVSITDALTGLRNRFAFESILSDEHYRARRYGAPLSLLLIDIDHFKPYNDTFGHQAGDEALRIVAELLEESVRESGTVARYGGEEFSVVLPNTDVSGAVIIADRCRTRIEQSGWEQRPITVSVGVATLIDELEDTASLLAAADGALYYSKTSGRNRVSHAHDVTTQAIPTKNLEPAVGD